MTTPQWANCSYALVRQRLRSKDSPPFRLHACDWTARLRERWQTEIRTAFAMRLRCLLLQNRDGRT